MFFRIDFDQQQTLVEFEKDQMEIAIHAFQQEIKSRLQAESDHRTEIKSVRTLIIIITRFIFISMQKIEMIFDEEIDVYVILNDLQLTVDCVVDYNEQLRQIVFTLQCYKNRINQLKKDKQRLLQIIKENQTELRTLKVEFDQNYSENENILEKQKVSH